MQINADKRLSYYPFNPFQKSVDSTPSVKSAKLLANMLEEEQRNENDSIAMRNGG